MKGFVERFDRTDDQSLTRHKFQRHGKKHRRGDGKRDASNGGSQTQE